MPLPPVMPLTEISQELHAAMISRSGDARKLRSLKALSPNMYAIRQIKNDGNGFYRGVMYSFIEKAIMAGALPQFMNQ